MVILMVMLIFFLYSIRCHEHALITASYSLLETCIHVVFIIILNLNNMERSIPKWVLWILFYNIKFKSIYLPKC